MDLKNEVEVNSPVEDVWVAFNDPERIAPCLPGAQLQEIDGDEFRGIVKVKIGPISAQYKGTAAFVEQDESQHRVVIRGEGRDTRGAGNATALITAQLEPIDESSTRVTVDTDLKLTGKVASFGRSGVIEDVSANLMTQFAEKFEAMMAESGSAAAAPADAAGDAEQPTSAPSGVRRVDHPEPEAVDLLDAAGAPIAKRVAPIVAVILLLWLLRKILGGGSD